MSDVPQMPGIAAELFQTRTTHENGTVVELQFDDGTGLSVEFSPDSEEAAEFLRLLTRLVNDKLRMLASRGVEITGFVPPGEDED